MALKFFDRTKQDATTSGTGTFTLSGTAATGGFRTFASVHTSGDEVFYCAVDSSSGNFEVGQGTLTSGGSWTLTRDIVKSSTNSNNKVNFASPPEIFSTYPAENAAFSDTTLSNNVVETDAVFDETLTANKALSGQFKGTLQFNKAFFTITDYTVASGQTLTVTDSADLYAVDIATGTVMDRTADFTDDVTISSDTMFSPGINAYATVTIANGVKATMSPVGTTFANNGAGITTGGPISWKLPTSDGAANTEIVTDGKGSFTLKGASATNADGTVILNPTTEILISTFDYNSYTPSAPIESLEVLVPNTVAASADLIESFRIKWVGVNLGGQANSTNNQESLIYSLAPITSAGGDVIFDNTSAQWQSYGITKNNVTTWSSAQGFTSGKDRTWTVSNGSYDSNTYGYALWGYQGQPQMTSRGSSSYYGPTIDSNPFTSDENNYMRTNITGEVYVMNNKYSLDTQQTFQWNGYSGTYGFNQYNYMGGGRPQQNATNTVYNSQTGRAKGFRMYFLPYDKNRQGSWGLVSGRIEVFATLKQDAAQITVA